MKFYVSLAFLDTSEVTEIARAADDLGYDGLGIPDHVINLETLKTPYPYTKDGKRRWEAFTDWPDPWVLIGALAMVTTRLRFVTTVYLPAMRDPYSAAKSIGTAALLADGRLELGIGVGWCEEEFTLMGQRFDRRGKRTDEMLELMKELWKPGWTEFDGEFYQTPRLEMEPTPPDIPIYVGGLSDIALRRAARHDGWIGDLITTDRALERIEKLRELRAEKGLSMDDFTVITPLTDAFTPEHYARAEAGGIDGIVTMPWMFYAGPQASAGREDRRHGAIPQGPGAGLAAAEPTQQAAARRAGAARPVTTPPAGCRTRSAHTAASPRVDGPGARAHPASSRNPKQNMTASSPPFDDRPEARRGVALEQRPVLSEVRERHLA